MLQKSLMFLLSSGPLSAKELVAEKIRGPKFAIVWVTNLQYHVTEGDVIMVQRLRAEIGSGIALKKVCMVGGSNFTAIGRPLLERARVVCDVEEQSHGSAKIYVNKPIGRRITDIKTTYHPLTVLRVRRIEYDPEVIAEVDKYRGDLLETGSSVNTDMHWARENPVPLGSAK